MKIQSLPVDFSTFDFRSTWEKPINSKSLNELRGRVQKRPESGDLAKLIAPKYFQNFCGERRATGTSARMPRGTFSKEALMEYTYYCTKRNLKIN
jgi:hypothetical protein